MVELNALTPCYGLNLPISRGQTTLQEADLGQLTSIAPFQGQQKALSDALKKAHGLGYPGPNETQQKGDARITWFGRDSALLLGVSAPADIGALAAVTDQSDAWVGLELSGAASADVLARLVPVDMRPQTLPEGHTVRTLLGHMNASITPTGKDTYLILVFRSMAETLVHEMQEAMEAVAARG